jgi:hypothetical protein
MLVKNMYVKGALLALLVTAATSASAANAINAFYNFDNVSSGTTANSLLGADGSFMQFVNPDTALDPDGINFHWIDASATYGDVLVKSDVNAVSGSNVLWNDHQPILLSFTSAVDINSFSIQQDLSGFGNQQANGSYIAFLDQSGHEISSLNQYYTQSDQSVAINPGKGLLLSTGSVANVYSILLSGGVNYDNLSINAVNVAAVPEADTYAMMIAGLGLITLVTRRRQNTKQS